MVGAKAGEKKQKQGKEGGREGGRTSTYQSTPHACVERAEGGSLPVVVDGIKIHLEELVGLTEAVPGPVVAGVNVHGPTIRLRGREGGREEGRVGGREGGWAGENMIGEVAAVNDVSI